MKANLYVPYEVLMVAAESTVRHFMSSVTSKPYPVRNQPSSTKNTDVEALFYPRSRSLCFQPHPEYKGAHARETHEVYFHFLDEYILSEIEEDWKDAIPF